MRTFAHKTKPTQHAISSAFTKPSRAFLGQSHQVSSVLRLQRTIGNQAVQRLQAKTEESEANSATSTSLPGFSHDFSRIAVHASAPVAIRPKLTISTPGDSYEQEADRIADAVMRRSDRKFDSSLAVTQSSKNTVVQRECQECEAQHQLKEFEEKRGREEEVVEGHTVSGIQSLRGRFAAPCVL